FFKGHRLADKVLGGWSISPIFTAQTGRPITLFDCTNNLVYCPRAFINGTVPDHGVTNVAAKAPDDFNFLNFSNLKIDNWFNPKFRVSDFPAFPKDLTGRNTIHTPGNWNVDVGINKNTRISERVNFQLRLEMYNAFNHSNFWVYLANTDVASYDFVDGYRN